MVETATQVPSPVPGDTANAAGAPSESAQDDRWWSAAWVCLAIGVALRGWTLGAHDLTYDEAFTGTRALHSPGEVLDLQRTADIHPPLDYLLRIPFASTGSELLLRIPSLMWSVGALVVLAVWMRRHGRFGALMVMAASFSPFLLLHGREARMYALVMFLGVVAAACASRWLERPSWRLAAGTASASGLALFSHSAALAGAGMLLFLPGLRRDRSAWIFRLAMVGSFLVWAVLWGPSFRDQQSSIESFWIPLSTPEWVEAVAASTVSPLAALVHVSAGLLALGSLVLVARQGPVGRVVSLVFVVPFVVLAVLGVELHVMLPRSFAFGSWAVAAALAAVVDELHRRLGLRGSLLGLAVVGLLIVPSAVDVVQNPRERHVALDELRTRVEPGDRIAISPSYFGPVVEWEFVAKDGFEVEGITEGGRFVIAEPSAAPSGRVHLLEHARLPIDDALADSGAQCGEVLETSSWLLRCVLHEGPIP